MLEFDLYAIWPTMQSAEIEKLTTLIDCYGESENENSIFQYYCETMGQHQSMDNVYAGLENLRSLAPGNTR
jgi:hypothetical protein